MIDRFHLLMLCFVWIIVSSCRKDIQQDKISINPEYAIEQEVLLSEFSDDIT